MSIDPGASLIFFLAELAMVALGVALLALVMIGLARILFGRQRRLEAELGLEVLDGRLARGEITREGYAIARRALGR